MGKSAFGLSKAFLTVVGQKKKKKLETRSAFGDREALFGGFLWSSWCVLCRKSTKSAWNLYRKPLCASNYTALSGSFVTKALLEKQSQTVLSACLLCDYCLNQQALHLFFCFLFLFFLLYKCLEPFFFLLFSFSFCSLQRLIKTSIIWDNSHFLPEYNKIK